MIAPVLVDVERHDDVAVHRHRRVGDEPVAADLGDEAAQPRPELDALGVELDRRRHFLLIAAARVAERVRSARTLDVADCVGDHAGRRAAAPAGLSAAPAARSARRAASAPRACRAAAAAPVRLRRRGSRRASAGGAASIRSEVLPRANGIGLVGFGARSDGARLADRCPKDRRAAAALAPACRGAAATKTNRRLSRCRSSSFCCCASSACWRSRLHAFMNGRWGQMRIRMTADEMDDDRQHRRPRGGDSGAASVGVSGR